MAVQGWSAAFRRNSAVFRRRIRRFRVLLPLSGLLNLLLISIILIGIPSPRASVVITKPPNNPQAQAAQSGDSQKLNAAQIITKSGDKQPQPDDMKLDIVNGYRAMTLMFDDVTGVEGYAQPGTFVDVVLTMYEGRALTTKIITQNARVLSTSIDTKANSIRAGHDRFTVTLEVKPEDALLVQVSKHLGRLTLLLRAPHDFKSPAKTEVDSSAIKGLPESKPIKSETKASK